MSERADPRSDARQLREDLATAIVDSYLHNPLDMAVRSASGLHVRYLPPGRVADLYTLYLASQRGAAEPAAGVWVFRKVWATQWCKALRFRKASTHTLCATCHKLRSLVRYSRSMNEHMAASALFLDHMRSQWLDREVYWRCRARARTERDVLTIITDGMDRSKFALPRWSEGRCPKGAAERARRPVLEVTGSIVHGTGLYIFVADEDMVVGSNWVCEVTMRALDLAFRRFQQKNMPWPSHLICQSDNTCREAKNGIFARFLISLLSASVFAACTGQHLQVGHTHEDVDAVFGLLARALHEARESLQTPQQVCQLLQSTLEPVFARNGEEVRVIYVSACRPWGDFLPQEVKLAGSWSSRATVSGGALLEAPHSFTYVPRRGLFAKHI